MKIQIEFEIDVHKDSKVFSLWLESVTQPIRLSRHLVPGSWKINIRE